ncbi:MAG TPA: GNAT family N-acetyltransferase [Solirubrobacteraceae bacterium]|nr:GNAT family N-acetyltransferase [Solirubrobacteraceae bacterium]
MRNDGTSETLTDRERELAGKLVGLLEEENLRAAGAGEMRELLATELDDDRELAGGVYGWTWGGTCWIEALWVREDLRRRGLGARLMEAAEQEARRRGCHQLALDSHTYQAPDFYRRLGFEVVGELPGFPGRHTKFLFRKRLGDAHTPG